VCSMDELEMKHGKDRERSLQDVLATWNDYQATGLHATAEEADAWLAKLEAGEIADAPEGHL
jgi:predicted transcriptional regulator